MVHSMQPLDVVNGMYSARVRGHGCVGAYLRSVRVPRSTGYGWEKKLRWLAEFGFEELRRVRRERDQLGALVSLLAEAAAAGPVWSRECERAFGRGSTRKGKTAAELAGIRLPTTDWIELLDLTAKPPAQASAKDA